MIINIYKYIYIYSNNCFIDILKRGTKLPVFTMPDITGIHL